MTVGSAVQISLEVDCDPICSVFGVALLQQLLGGRYDLCSVMRLPSSVDEWRLEHRTARKRAARAERRGYEFVTVDRAQRADEVYAINVSAPERQGRPMSDGYRRRPAETPDPGYPCPRHGVHCYGVETADGTLVAYMWLYRAGQLALVSQILGHADHLENEIMYLLWQAMIEREAREPGFVVYNRHDSGTDGLRFYKERVGLAETPVAWLP
jgi:hypothetical protein